MSSMRNPQVGYGLTDALPNIFIPPIISLRAPTTADKAQLGALWIYKTANAAYVLTSIVNNSATWSDITGGAGIFTSLTVTPGPISLTGTTTINTTGAATTTIGTGGTGAVNIGNATGGTTVTGLLTTGALTTTGTVLINATGAAVTTIGTGGTGAVNIGNTTGDVALTGALTISEGLTVASKITTTDGDVVAGNTEALTTGPNVELRKSRNGGVITTGDVLGNVIFEGNNGVDNIAGGAIVVQSTGTIAANRVAGVMSFWTHPDSTNPLKSRMSINSAGNVVIAAPDTGLGLEIANGGLSVLGDTTLLDGNLIINAAAKYVELPGGIRLYSGAGAPGAGLANVAGSTYFRTNPGGATERIYVATGAGTWTNVTCAA